MNKIAIACFLTVELFIGVAASAIDHVSFTRDGKDRDISGRLLVTAQDGGLLIVPKNWGAVGAPGRGAPLTAVAKRWGPLLCFGTTRTSRE